MTTSRLALAALVVACARRRPRQRRSARTALEPRLTKALTGAVALARPDGGARRRPRRRARRSTRTTSDVPFAPASNEKIPVSFAALTRLGTGLPVPHRGVRRRQPRTAPAWDGDLVLKGFGDPTLVRRRPRAPRGDDPRARDPLGHRAGPRRRVVLRLEARRCRLEAVLPRRRDSAALGADRRPGAGLAGALATAPRGPRAPGRARAPGRRRSPAARDSASLRRTRRRSPRTRPTRSPTIVQAHEP